MLSLRIFTSQLTVLKTKKKINVPRWSWQVETLMLWWSQREWLHRPVCLNIWFPAGETLWKVGRCGLLREDVSLVGGLRDCKSLSPTQASWDHFSSVCPSKFFPPLLIFSLFSLFSPPLSFFYNFHLSFSFHLSISFPLFLTYYSFFMVCSPTFLSTIGDWYV